MSPRNETKAEGGFVEKLERLRTKIDTLPEPHRPHLHELADTIREQYDKHAQHKTVQRNGGP